MATSTIKNAFSIPFKIKRSPTDLLKALSKTVDLDPLGPSYSLIDDTILTPLNPTETKKVYLAKASGIKAARFMIQKYPQAFMKDDCEPHVEKFFPPKEFSEEELKYPSEDLIYSLMNWGKFKQAYDTYLKCKDQNIEVSEGCKLVMLDLLSINNNSDLKERAPITEEWIMRGQTREAESKPRYSPTCTWVKNGEAEQIFNELKTKSAEAYCSLIKGMAKHNDMQSAENFYKEMIANNLVPDLNTINSLLKLIIYKTDTQNEKKLELMLEKLNEIKNYGMLPNLTTFNTCLDLIKSIGMNQKSIPIALNILKEMQILKIEPSLATYSSVLSIFYPNRDYGSKTGILKQVIDEVELLSAKPDGLQWRDINDSTFFKVAMEKCVFANDDLNLVKRLHTILMKNNNIKFLNDNYLFNKYFENYLLALMNLDLPENVIKEWRNVTPYIFNRSIRVLDRMVEYVHENKCFDFVPELWSNMIELKIKRITEFCSYVIQKLLLTMSQYEENNQDLNQKYATISETMVKQYSYLVERVENDDESDQSAPIQREYNWDAKMLSNFFKVVLRVKNLDLAWSEFDKYVKNQSKVPGELDEKCITSLFDTFLEANQIDRAFDVLNLAVSMQLPVLKSLVKKCETNKNVNSDKRAILKQLKEKLSIK